MARHVSAKMAQVEVNLSHSIIETIDKIAGLEGSNRSAVIRRIVTQWYRDTYISTAKELFDGLLNGASTANAEEPGENRGRAIPDTDCKYPVRNE